MRPTLRKNVIKSDGKWEEDTLRRFQIKPCRVLLSNMCSAHTAQKGVEFLCDIRRTDENTFHIGIKRKNCDQKVTDDSNSFNPRKKMRRIPSNEESQTIASRLRSTKVVNSNLQRKELNGPKKPTKKDKDCKALQKSDSLPKPVPHNLVQIGEIVLCKIGGWTEWSAIVSDINGNSIHVEFFGDHKTHITTIKNIYRFDLSSNYILYNLRRFKTQLYAKAVKEAETYLGIPPDQSIFSRLS